MQEEITKSIIKKVVPIYGKIFHSSDLTLEEVKRVSSEDATEEERREYYSYGVTSFKSTAGIIAFPVSGIGFWSIIIFKGFSIIIPITLFFFLILLSIGTDFEIIALKSKNDSRIRFTKKHLVNSVLTAIFSTLFFSLLLFVGLDN